MARISSYIFLCEPAKKKTARKEPVIRTAILRRVSKLIDVNLIMTNSEQEKQVRPEKYTIKKNCTVTQTSQTERYKKKKSAAQTQTYY